MTFGLQSGFDFPFSGRGIGKGPVYLSPMLLYLSNNQSKIIQIGSSYHLGQLITGVWTRFGGIQPIESIVGFGFKKVFINYYIQQKFLLMVKVYNEPWGVMKLLFH